MALQITPNARTAGNLNITANQRARMSSVLSIDWDSVTGKPAALDALGSATVGMLALTDTSGDPGTVVGRTITGTANEITVTNGSGIAGNPTASLPSALTFTGKTITGGTYSGAVSFNGNFWTVGTGTLTLGAGKTATISNTLTFTGTDASSVAFGTGGTVAYTANNLSVFAATTSAQLAGIISDETGSGALVFGTSPTISSPTISGHPTIEGVTSTGATGTGKFVFDTAPSVGVLTVTSINKVAITAPATSATLTLVDGTTLTGPAASGTAMTLGNVETITGAKTFNDAKLILAGVTSGTTTLKATGTAAGVVTLPAATDTLVGKATTDTLTNKTFDTAGTGNIFSINGVAATANSGTGAVARVVSPAFTTPALGTPSSGTLTSCTGLPLSGLAAQAAWTFVFNNTSGSASPTANTIDGLTNKASPAAGDEVILWDVAGTAIKKTTVSALASAGSVSSIAGNTGAFTLSQGLTNATNDLRMDVSYLQGNLSGLILSKSAATTVGVTAGVSADSTNVSLMKLATAYTKTFSAWAVGSTNGGIDTGSIATNTWYHIWQIMRSDTSVVDILISTSATAPTMPTNYDRKRRIGSIKTDATPNIVAFIQNGDNFMWSVPFADVNATNPGTAAVTRTLTTPTGLITEAIIGVAADCNSAADTAAAILISDLAVADSTPGAGAFTIYNFSTATGRFIIGGQARVNTNTSSQVRSRLGLSAAATVLIVNTLGWVDTRGRFA